MRKSKLLLAVINESTYYLNIFDTGPGLHSLRCKNLDKRVFSSVSLSRHDSGIERQFFDLINYQKMWNDTTRNEIDCVMSSNVILRLPRNIQKTVLEGEDFIKRTGTLSLLFRFQNPSRLPEKVVFVHVVLSNCLDDGYNPQVRSSSMSTFLCLSAM